MILTDEKSIIDKIKVLINSYFGVSFEQIDKETRGREVMLARQLMHYLSKTYTTYSYKQIGYLTKKKYHHSTIINSKNQIQDILDLGHRSPNYFRVNAVNKELELFAIKKL